MGSGARKYNGGKKMKYAVAIRIAVSRAIRTVKAESIPIHTTWEFNSPNAFCKTLSIISISIIQEWKPNAICRTPNRHNTEPIKAVHFKHQSNIQRRHEKAVAHSLKACGSKTAISSSMDFAGTLELETFSQDLATRSQELAIVYNLGIQMLKTIPVPQIPYQ